MNAFFASVAEHVSVAERFLTSDRGEKIAAFVITAISAYLLTCNLDYASLWHDEGVNAIIARGLAEGRGFSGWDGRNLFFGAFIGTGINENLNIVSYPPWPAMISSVGVFLFGDSEFAVRFPHALLGALSLPLMYALLQMFFPSARLRLFAFALFALSPVVILYSRQGRYYADAIFFALLCFYCYQKYRENGNVRWAAGLAVGTVLGFLNHFAIGFCMALSLALWHLILYWRETSRQQWLVFAGAGAFSAAACGGYVLLFLSGGGLEFDSSVYQTSWIERHATLLYYYFRDMILFGWLPLWAVLWWLWRGGHALWSKINTGKKKRKKAARQPPPDNTVWHWVLMAFLLIMTSALVSVQPVHNTQFADMRYMVMALPFLIFMSAACADRLWQINRIAGAALLSLMFIGNWAGHPWRIEKLSIPAVIRVLSGGNWAGYPTFTRERLTMPALVGEIHAPYYSAVEEAVTYLNKHASQDETIYANPWQDYVMLLYYLSDKLIFCCGLSEQSQVPHEKVRSLGVPLYADDVRPDWVVLFPWGPNKIRETPPDYEKVYEGKAYAYPAQRPEIEWHSFRALRGKPSIVIYRRMNNDN